ncbi:cytochrome P450 [Streptomyces nigra]|uniref:cytochrome P450 n=1 Tax=Streptomyces nigra TaxID=1827580 RepID=UPI0037D0AC3F
MFAFPRYEQVRSALTNWRVFSSAQGVMMNEHINAKLAGVTLCSDPPEHQRMREVLGRPLHPERVRELTPQLTAEAKTVVDRVIAIGMFDAVSDLAEHVPMAVVSDLVGIGPGSGPRMLEWVAGTYDAPGPIQPKAANALAKVADLVEFVTTEAVPGRGLNPDGWAGQLYAAAERGEIEKERCPGMVIDYIAPSMDSTISAISSMIHLFAKNPDQWELLRADPTLVSHAVHEVLRLESPFQRFTRVLTEDHEVEGHMLPAGSRVVLMYGSANRDERKYPDPDRFDIRRRPTDQLAFGRGVHVCIGLYLARVEMEAILVALLSKVERFELMHAEWESNTTLRKLRSLRVRVYT